MKHVIIIPEGAGDAPLAELDGRTSLQAAKIPTLDRLATHGRLGVARTIPAGTEPRAETALLSLLGYDPMRYPAGFAAIEAFGLGLELAAGETVLRCNLVMVVDGVLRDQTAGFIRTSEAEAIFETISDAIGDDRVRFHVGDGHRHLCVVRDGAAIRHAQTTPPHDALGREVRRCLPSGRGREVLLQIQQTAAGVLALHDVNMVRIDLGEGPATDIWLWGEGPLPELPAFAKRFGARGAMIAGSGLARGLARLIRWEVIDVPGATGLPDTDYAAKGRAAVEAIDRTAVVCVHVQAPDIAAHQGVADEKIAALEAIDRDIVAPVYERLSAESEWRLLVAPSLTTLTSDQHHAAAPPPLLLAGSGIDSIRGEVYDEEHAAEGELQLDRASDLMEFFLKR